MPMHSPPHPGQGLKLHIEALGLTIAKAAEQLGVTRQQLYRVVSGDSAISPEMALRLEAVIGSTADHWMRKQCAFDLARIRNGADNPARTLRKFEPE